jgi:hypothetical protein
VDMVHITPTSASSWSCSTELWHGSPSSISAVLGQASPEQLEIYGMWCIQSAAPNMM